MDDMSEQPSERVEFVDSIVDQVIALGDDEVAETATALLGAMAAVIQNTVGKDMAIHALAELIQCAVEADDEEQGTMQ